MTEQERKDAGLNPYCPCGSGDCREAQYDGHGIFLTYTCDRCYTKKMAGFRLDIFDRYDCDEPIDEE